MCYKCTIIMIIIKVDRIILAESKYSSCCPVWTFIRSSVIYDMLMHKLTVFPLWIWHWISMLCWSTWNSHPIRQLLVISMWNLGCVPYICWTDSIIRNRIWSTANYRNQAKNLDNPRTQNMLMTILLTKFMVIIGNLY